MTGGPDRPASLHSPLALNNSPKLAALHCTAPACQHNQGDYYADLVVVCLPSILIIVWLVGWLVDWMMLITKYIAPADQTLSTNFSCGWMSCSIAADSQPLDPHRLIAGLFIYQLEINYIRPADRNTSQLILIITPHCTHYCALCLPAFQSESSAALPQFSHNCRDSYW